MSEAHDPKAALIDRYKAAYRAANGFDYPGKVTAERGWFTLDSHGIVKRYRMKGLTGMAERLEARHQPKDTPNDQ